MDQTIGKASRRQSAPELDVQIRPYAPGDLDAIVRLDALCFDPPFRFSKAAMRRYAEARNAIVRLAFLRTEDVPAEELAAFSIVHLERSEAHGILAYLVTLDVSRACRGRGLAYAMVHTIEELAKDAGAQIMQLHVSVSNAQAIRLYERLGYARAGFEQGFYAEGGDALVYERGLASEGKAAL